MFFTFLDLEIFLDDGLNLEDVDDEIAGLNPDPQTDGEEARKNYISEGYSTNNKNSAINKSSAVR